MTGFLEMGNSIEGHFRGICKIIFFVNGMLLLLLVLHLALVFYICMVYLVFFTLYCFSILICADLVRKSFGCFDLRSVFVDTVPWALQLFLTLETLIFKDGCQSEWIKWSSRNTLSLCKNMSLQLLSHSLSNVYSCFL